MHVTSNEDIVLINLILLLRRN